MPDFDFNRYLQVSVDPEGQVVSFHFRGRLDTEVSTELSSRVLSVLDREMPAGEERRQWKIVFDLDEVVFVSSLFLRVCFIAVKNAEKGNFSIVHASQQVNSILKMSGLEKVTRILNKDEDVRVFRATEEFARQANVRSLEEFQRSYRRSLEDPEGFWREKALAHIEWFQPFDEVLKWELPVARWFRNGKLNVCYNCLDKHLPTPVADRTALMWEGEPWADGRPLEKRELTYRQLHSEVCAFANVLRNLGIGKGDRVLLYLPMIPEAVIAMLACARIGAIHSVVFAGFSSQAIAERAEDCQACLIITADESFRRGKPVPLKVNVDKALELGSGSADSRLAVSRVLMIERTGRAVPWTEGRDFLYSRERRKGIDSCPPEAVDSEDNLFILYTSGSTGKPKGIYHSSAGYLLGAHLTFRNIMDQKEQDIFWCTADIGWITGHSYVVYGPLSNGATIFLYEGAPDFPECDRFWKIIESNRITIFYTAPTAIRAFMKWGESWLQGRDLGSLRLLGTVGEPINPEAWLWYYENIGKSNCPIVDTWWQTETGSIMISPLPGATCMKPGSVGIPFWGIEPDIVDDQGNPQPVNSIGNLIIRRPWPSMTRGIWASAERFRKVYWSDFPGSYFTGDCARRDADGFYWIVGRTDDVIVVSGHNIGTAEVESALVAHHSVAESAVVGRPDDLKTTVIVAFVVLKSGVPPSDRLVGELRQKVVELLGPLAKPEEIRFSESLPKTRSGKIMRRLLRQIASGTMVSGDVTTLEDFAVLEKLAQGGGPSAGSES